MAIGTPAYMAPEQLAADPDADQRVDLYAVGLLAYELLSGVSPFAAPSPTATMTAQLTRVPQALHELHDDIPPAFSALVQHLLAKSPEDRPPDAQAVLAELDQISGALAADVHRSTSGETRARAHASSLPLVLATAGVFALVAAGVWWTQMRSPLVISPDSNAAVRLGTDTDLNVPLPVKPMTHKDSLKLLEDLREQLGQADPKYSAKPVSKPATTDQAPLEGAGGADPTRSFARVCRCCTVSAAAAVRLRWARRARRHRSRALRSRPPLRLRPSATVLPSRCDA